jgi:LAO/AO transport system kinase
MDAVKAVLSGNRLALARLLTQIENDTSEGRTALDVLFSHTGNAHLIGVTGAPGTGKSSLVNRLAHFYRHPPGKAEPVRVAVVAVDPSSPFTGGAVLGDRIRMRDLAGDPDVFIRSMASRGSLGGLANATAGVVQAFDAAGFDLILIETVGAGQAEVDIAKLAHTTLVIEAPGLGDDIQAIKAGILEIADILVINKADRPGVGNTESALRGMLNLAHPSRYSGRFGNSILQAEGSEAEGEMWVPPIQRTIAIDGTGIPELGALIADHRQHLEDSGGITRRERFRLKSELENMLRETLVTRWRKEIPESFYQELLDRLVAREISPWRAVEELIDGGAQS